MFSLKRCVAVALLGAVTVSADPRQASNFNLSSKIAEEHACGATCQKILADNDAADLQIFGTDFDFSFYETARNFSNTLPGDILKLQPINSSTISVPSGVAVYKMQYTTMDLDGSYVPATGFIAFPFAHTSKPFNLVAYAHGTSGVFRGCAPSTSPTLFDYNSWTLLVQAGYAVVATDYAGLGNNYIAHKYISSAANANDILYSVMAAHNAFPGILSRAWVSVGHSQGGGAVWKLSEHKLVQNITSGYLGGVSVSPVTKIYDELQAGIAELQSATNIHDYHILGVIPSLAIAIKAVFPDYNIALLSDEIKKRVELASIGELCDIAMSGLVRDLSLDEIFTNISKTVDPRLEEFQKINAPAQGDLASRPLLVIQGTGDTIVFEDGTSAAYNESCKSGNQLHLSLYPKLEHTAVLTAAFPEWLTFIADRFAGKTFGCGCSNTTVTPFDLDYAASPSENA